MTTTNSGSSGDGHGQAGNGRPKRARRVAPFGAIRHPRKRAFLAAYAQTGNISAAALAAGTHRSNHYLWLQKDPVYAAEFSNSHEEAVERLESEARRRAVAGSDILLMFLLKAARPSVYRDNYVRAGQVVLTTAPADRVLTQEEVLAAYALSISSPAAPPAATAGGTGTGT